MMKLLFFLLMNQSDYTNKIEKNNMIFSWVVSDSYLNCQVKAPGKGWVAMGLNDQPGLEGTNLIMGAVSEEFYTLGDRYIVKPGVHKSMLELGADEAIRFRFGKEDQNETTIRFSIPLKSPDQYHHDLIKGKTYYILLAYSIDDDFDHHSFMRTSVKIKL